MPPRRRFAAIRAALFALALPILVLGAARASQPPDPPGAQAIDPAAHAGRVVRVYYPDRAALDVVTSQIEPWEVHPAEGYLLALVDEAQIAWLQGLGLRVEIDAALTAAYNQPPAMLPGQVSGIPAYPCYRTVEETYTTALGIAANYPGLAGWIDIGDTWKKEAFGTSGYDMRVLKLTNALTPGPKPALLVTSSIHAREYAPAELNTRFAEYLVQNYNVDPDVTWLLDYTEVHLLLQSNPDGRKRAETGLTWRKNTDNNFCSDTNQRGVDLNRNFDFEWGCCGGSSVTACSEIYRGPSAGSEPETRAIQDYMRAVFADQRPAPLDAPPPLDAAGVYIDLHSYGNLVLWPWGFTIAESPSAGELQTLGRKLAYFNKYTPEQSYYLYTTDGTTDDFAYGDLGVAAYTIEMGSSFFQDCATFENTILPANLPALLYAARVARDPYLSPAGPDALSAAVSPTLYFGAPVIQVEATLDDSHYRNSNGAEPTQNISAARYTVDQPPWITTTLAISMTAADGGFDSRVEHVAAPLDLAGLELGRHIVFVQGMDAAGNWGPVSAVFVYVTPEWKAFLPALSR